MKVLAKKEKGKKHDVEDHQEKLAGPEKLFTTDYWKKEEQRKYEELVAIRERMRRLRNRSLRRGRRSAFR